ncbi:hypothetical protein KUTeg_013350 [Tegillarca granosa]|uniref:palmitoyl-protein hydrolase n=1 Tax=Tegillarca granosa TaxID=220873 RepID=A0ABQ9EVV7_TEGGR|nr:hypothetical protein KUTeg_013350 [Tegillarca granosa]
MINFVRGFSMGGAMAMTLAYKYHWDLAGVFALSSFLNYNSSVYKVLEQKSDVKRLPPLYMCHGNRDTVTDVEWAKETLNNLKSLGVKGELDTFDIDHELIKEEIETLRYFIYKQLPNRSRL